MNEEKGACVGFIKLKEGSVMEPTDQVLSHHLVIHIKLQACGAVFSFTYWDQHPKIASFHFSKYIHCFHSCVIASTHTTTVLLLVGPSLLFLSNTKSLLLKSTIPELQ